MDNSMDNLCNILSNYRENGYYIARQIIDKSICNQIILELDKIKTDMNIPFTNIQFGYGNIINNELSNYITDNKFIKTFLHKFYEGEYYYNSLYVHNKHRWVGPDVEWHQEVFNIKTFHPTNNELSMDYILNSYMQVYIPLQKQNLENGCVKIIPKGHKLGILKSYDTLNTHLNHKRAILPEELDRAYAEYGIINLDLNPGDAVFFNHLIPHSSSSNNGPYDRKAMVFLTYKNIENLDENKRSKEKEFRKNFAIKSLENKLNKLKMNCLYDCKKQKIRKNI